MESQFLPGASSSRRGGPSRPSRPLRTSSLDIPAELGDGPDAQDDITAPRTRRERLMNQSFLSVLVNAGTQPDLPVRSKTETSQDDRRIYGTKSGADKTTQNDISKSLGSDGPPHWPSSSLRQLRHPPIVQEEDEDLRMMTTSQILKPPYSFRGTSGGGAPSTTKEAEHSLLANRTLQSQDSALMATDTSQVETVRSKLLPDLTERLVEIFGLEEREELIAEYPCWLLQSVMLPGYMYVLQKHICFHAYLPRKPNTVIKSGYLKKRGQSSPKFSRYWFVLKDNVLSYYADPSDLYFPSGHIDLQLATAAGVPEPDNTKDDTTFTISIDTRTHRLKADSSTSASEWVKQIQRVIFRSHQDGDIVKIRIPVDNVMDIEDSPVTDFTDTLKIRVVDNGETYAVDEYYFSFLDQGQDALQVLRVMTDNTTAIKDQDALAPRYPRDGDQTLGSEDLDQPPTAHEIRARIESSDTLTPYVLAENNQDRSSENSFPSPIISRIPVDPPGHLSSTESEFSDAANMLDDDRTQASQILQGSAVFGEPTITRSHESIPEKINQDDSKPPDERLDSNSGESRTPRSMNDRQLKATHEELRADSPTVKTSASNSKLQEFMRAGTYPLETASGIANLLSTHSRRMGSKLASESLGYYEKVTSMWAGKQIHYEPGPQTQEDHIEDQEDKEISHKHGARFRTHFALPDTERLRAAFYVYLQRVIPVYGKVYISDRKLCYRSLIPRNRTKMVLPLKDIESVDPEKGFRFGFSGLVISIRGHEEIFFEFTRIDARDDCAVTLIQTIEALKGMQDSDTLPSSDKLTADAAEEEYLALLQARKLSPGEPVDDSLLEDDTESTPVMFDDPTASMVSFKPPKPLKITCLTIGSRGDVQPYIALCKGLIAEGHKPTIATHPEFKSWIEYYGIGFAPVAGDPTELMKLCVETDMFTPSFFRETWTKSRDWLGQLLRSSWKACQNTDLLIESPSAMCGIHIAEALNVPYFRAFSMPWTRTRAFPHAFAVPTNKRGGYYNYMTYVMIENIFWGGIQAQINRWRTDVLGIGSTNLDKLRAEKVPFLYWLSPAVVPPPPDYSEWIHTTGYWCLDEGENWTPPNDLANFIAEARKDNKKLVYIGFGSITVPDPAALTRVVVESVTKADVRCILSKGWSDRLETGSPSPRVPLPASILSIEGVPHDWLFGQIDAVAHHGGAGTTGASLRAGLPTIIKPFFGDQYFYGSRVETLGVGICLNKVMNTSVFARALWRATHDDRMIVKARILGDKIRKEDGVGNAIQNIYRDLEYARTFRKTSEKTTGEKSEPIEESWTMIGEEDAASVRKPSAGLDPSATLSEHES